MDIRRLTPDDAEGYRKIRLEALQNDPEAFSSSYEEEIENPIQYYEDRLGSESSYTYGAFDEEALIGIVTLVRETRTKIRHRAGIFAMYVTGEKRGLGTGRRLMEAAIGKSKELNGVEQIHLTVMAENEPAKKLYASMGFDRYGTEKHALKIENRFYDEELRMLFL